MEPDCFHPIRKGHQEQTCNHPTKPGLVTHYKEGEQLRDTLPNKGKNQVIVGCEEGSSVCEI